MRKRTDRRWWPGLKPVALAFGAGLLAALGQAPFDLWLLALGGYGALAYAVAKAQGARHQAVVGLFGGAGHFALALSWIVEPFLIVPEVHGWMAPFALVLMAFGLGLFWALAAVLAGLIGGPRDARLRLLAFAVTLSLSEMLRGFIFTGFPWALPGHIWIDTPAAQLAAWIGGYGLTLLTMLVAVLPVIFWSQNKTLAVALPGVLLASTWSLGWSRLAEPMPEPRPELVRLVQPNAAQSLKWDPALAQANFDVLGALSMEPTASGQTPALIVWPETAVPWLLDDGPILQAIASTGQGAEVAVGIQRSNGARGWNSLAVIGPEAQLGPVYDKIHLVPFGEYIPFGDFLWEQFGIGAFASQIGASYSAGTQPMLLDFASSLPPALPLICYEAVFPQDLRAAPAGAGWILQITNDAWFGTQTGPYQHLAQARLRAIEQGLPLLRAANTGITAVIDSRGQILAALPLGERGVIDHILPAAWPQKPLYTRFGELSVLSMLLLLAVGVVALRRYRHGA